MIKFHLLDTKNSLLHVYVKAFSTEGYRQDTGGG